VKAHRIGGLEIKATSPPIYFFIFSNSLFLLKNTLTLKKSFQNIAVAVKQSVPYGRQLAELIYARELIFALSKNGQNALLRGCRPTGVDQIPLW